MSKEAPSICVRISLTIQPALLAEVDQRAESMGLTRSAYVSQVLEDAGQEEAALRAVLGSPSLISAFADVFARPGVLKQLVMAAQGDKGGKR